MILDPDTVVAAAARRQRRAQLPSPRNLPIDTFVVLMMENRSFDHYLGWLPGADGRQAGLHFTDTHGKDAPTHRLANNFQGCGFLDPDHSWDGGRTEMDSGRMDGFLKADSDVFSIGYYAEQDLPFMPHVAKAYTAFDRFFCSLLSSTYPNREYMHAGQSYGMKDNSLPTSSGGFPDTTIFARAQEGRRLEPVLLHRPAGVRVLGGERARPLEPGADLLRAGRQRDAAGALVRGSFVQRRGPGDIGRRAPARGRPGRAGVHLRRRARVHRIPQYKTGALFIVYDEWGGFFDHVVPPRVPDLRSSTSLDERLRADGPQDSGRRRLALRPARPRRPLDLRVRVDPEDDPLPLRSAAPDPARPLRQQHRGRIRLGSGPGSSRRRCRLPPT